MISTGSCFNRISVVMELRLRLLVEGASRGAVLAAGVVVVVVHTAAAAAAAAAALLLLW